MANTVIQIKSSGVVGNVPSTLFPGELAINYEDGKLYYGDSANQTVLFDAITEPAGLNGELQFNDSGSFGSDATLSFNSNTKLLIATAIQAGSLNVEPAIQAAYNQANSALSNTNLNVLGTIRSLSQGGDEGGELFLDKPVTNTSLSAGITIDVYQNKLRIFETGGSVRGVFIDIANSASSGVGTDLLNPSATPDTVARTLANAAFDKANSAGSYANSAYGQANTADQKAVTSGSYANSAFAKANTASIDALSSGSYANSAFAKANNALANTTGTFSGSLTLTGNLTATSITTTGSSGDISGANVVYANTFTANTRITTPSLQVTGDTTITGNLTVTGTSSFTDTFARTQANSAYLHANAAFVAANNSVDTWVRSAANSASSYANSAFTQANSATILAQAAFDTANTGTPGGSFDLLIFFPTGDYGFITDSTEGFGGEILLKEFDCKVGPNIYTGYSMNLDFEYLS